ncbi:hypothetical protein [Nocardia vaccinii]|uniref:hypothetical protein n=1 Tax=Nocardia vaccinii TaxID=1822 RepID=UPI000A06BA98|nr:hypothetical protein [Nocardia vaccinii]
MRSRTVTRHRGKLGSIPAGVPHTGPCRYSGAEAAIGCGTRWPGTERETSSVGRTSSAQMLRMLVSVPVIAIGVALACYLLLLGYTGLMRLGWVSDRTRRFSRTVNRRLPDGIAGTRLGMLYFDLSVLHHVGRRSGRPYSTPLSAFPLGDGFVLAVAYPRVDWCENVLAAGRCTLTRNGEHHALERPELVPISDALKAYPLLVRPFILAAGMDKFLWLHRSAPEQS